jgi:hypothetical protein
MKRKTKIPDKHFLFFPFSPVRIYQHNKRSVHMGLKTDAFFNIFSIYITFTSLKVC